MERTESAADEGGVDPQGIAERQPEIPTHGDTELPEIPPTADLLLSTPFNLAPGEILSSLESDGALQLGVSIITLNDGQIAAAERWDGAAAMAFPPYSESNDPPFAVIRVDPRDMMDLVPKEADFSFGVLFRKDATSEGSDVDNGDNLLQRGDAGHPAQYKLQVDHGNASCVLRGADGALHVRVDHVIDPELWYFVTCERRGDSARIRLTEYRLDGTTERMDEEVSGPIGSIEWEDGPPPLSVGGKLTRGGEIAASDSDQFNGLLDSPFVQIDVTDIGD